MNVMRWILLLLFFSLNLSLKAQVDKSAKTYPIKWVELVGLEFNERNGKLEKTVREESWGFSGAISSNLLGSGEDGFVAFNAIRQSDFRFIGLSSENIDAHYTSMEYALYLTRSNIYICESGMVGRSVGKYREGDLFSIERRGEWILFNHNTHLIHRIKVDPTKELFVDVALSGPDVVLEDVYATFPETKYPWWDEDPIVNPNNCTVNNTMNWIETTAYDRDGDVIASAKSYSNYLGKPLQTQQMNLTENKVLASQPIYDKYGRPVIQTLSAPVDQSQFCFKEDFVTNQYGEIYDYEDFDIPNNTNSENYIASGEVDKPRKVGNTQEGTLGWYYSDNNTLEPYVATTGYPYSRIEYDENNPGRQKRAASPGNHHRMGKGHESESYTMLEAGELMYVYGPLESWIFEDGLPGYQISKTITIDADGKQVVSYTDIDGKLIASCMAGQVDNQNQNTILVTSIIGEKGYVDIHLPEGCENSLTLHSSSWVSYRIMNLQTGKYVEIGGSTSIPGGTPELESGFYRISKDYEIWDYDVAITYSLNYYEFALNYYDDAGRLVKSVPPLGIDHDLLDYGEIIVNTDVNTFSDPFYCAGLFPTPCPIYYQGYDSTPISYTLSSPTAELVYTELKVGFNPVEQSDPDDIFVAGRVATPDHITVLDFPKEQRELYMSGGLPQMYTTNRKIVGLREKTNEGVIRGAGRFYKVNNPQAKSISWNNQDVVDVDGMSVLGDEPDVNDDLDETEFDVEFTVFYKLRFNLFSGVSDVENPDIAQEAEIVINRGVSAGNYVTFTEYNTQISTDIRELTNQVNIELIEIVKIVETEITVGGVLDEISYSTASLTSEDLIFLSGYEIMLTAYNNESNRMNHLLEENYTYNTMGWLLSSTTPDGGLTEYNYRRDGSLRFSQNEKQEAQDAFSYTNYDKIGRVIEVGEYTANQTHESFISTYYPPDFPLPSIAFQDHKDYQQTYNENIESSVSTTDLTTMGIVNTQDGLDDSHCHQNTFYSYDKPDSGFEDETGLSEVDYRQRFVRGKLSKSWTDKPYTSATWYSYDEQGRVVWMVQKVEGLGVKTVDYLYDEKGNVHQVIYQKQQPLEAFYHKYQYDADNRLLKVETSTDATNWQKEAEYQYYLHGPLKRVELAEDLQGIDYLYTVQGQLKSINSPNLGTTASDVFTDPGGDGDNEFATDVFGMSIDYYSGDYARAGTHVNYTTPNQSSFAGNISSVRWNTQGMGLANIGKQNIYKYAYEHHNWLSGATFGSYSPNSCQNAEQGAVYCSMLDDYQTVEKGDAIGPNTFSFSFNTVPNSNEDYKVSNIIYDANGNLLSLHRNGYTDASEGLTNTMDAMDYHYSEDAYGNRIDNKLTHISDVTHANNEYADVNTQSVSNYIYNEIGQLESNAEEGHYYTYDAYGLLTGVYKDAEHMLSVAKYFYDDKGYRVRKALYDSDNSNLLTSNIWYVRDAAGNLLSLYEQDVTEEMPITEQTEVPIYAASRIGQYQPNNNGQKIYELTDHLGTVRAVMKRLTQEEELAGEDPVIMVADYYPFGMKMPGRQIISEYRYGYQGQFAEKDGETSLNSFEYRNYDSRIGRWNSVDNYGQHYSPYLAMRNSPIMYVDADGNVDWKVVGSGVFNTVGGVIEVAGGLGATSTGIGATLGVVLVFDGGTRAILGFQKIVAGVLEKDNANEMLTNIGGTVGWMMDDMPSHGVGPWQQTLSVTNDVFSLTSGSSVNALKFYQTDNALMFLGDELSNIGLYIANIAWDNSDFGGEVIDFGMMDEIELINGVVYE
jgi:RHS repeat-associated protein